MTPFLSITVKGCYPQKGWTMKDLIERLEKAPGPSYELSQDIGRALGLRQRYEHPGSENLSWPHYTYSLDSALTLVPEGHSVNLQMPRLSGQSESARVWDNDRTEMGVAPTVALALCIAALRARAAADGPQSDMEAGR
jgi:hypothetical protein